MATDDTTATGASQVDQIVDSAGEALERGLLPSQVFNDRGVHEAELRRIFARSWVFVGFESEIPDAGDYAQRYIGTDPYIFVRDEDGELHVLFNSCTHHGSKLCKAEQGNTSHFRCPYHGWTFKNDGSLTGVPHQKDAFRELDKSEHGLFEAPRIASHRGMVFASLEADGPTLKEHIGDFLWYLDIQLLLGKGGMEVIGEPHRWRASFNWKTGCDNFSADSYHNTVTHKSAIDIGFGLGDVSGAATRSEWHRHVTDADAGSSSLRMLDPDQEIFFGHPHKYVTDEHLSEEQYRIASASGSHAATIFPNLSYIHGAYRRDPQGEDEVHGMWSVRKWRPVAPDEVEIVSWVLAPADAPAEYKRRAYDTAVETFSPSGNFEMDDVQVWEGIAEAGGSLTAEKTDFKLNYQMGMEGMSKANVDPDWPGPGVAWDDNLEEGTCRTFHRNWYEAMRTDASTAEEDG